MGRQYIPRQEFYSVSGHKRIIQKNSSYLFSGVNPDLNRGDAAPLIVVEQPHVDARAPRRPHEDPALVTAGDSNDVTAWVSTVIAGGGAANGARGR